MEEPQQETKQEILLACETTAESQPEVKPKGKKNLKESAKEFFTTRRMTYIAAFSALAAILYIFNPLKDVPLGIFPSFFDFKICDVPALIAGFMLGPVAGCIVVIIKIVLKMASGTSSTQGVGELSDLITGIAFVLIASLIYKKYKTEKGAILGLAVGSVASIVMAVLANWLIIVPFFVFARFGGDWSILVNMLKVLFSQITQENFYLYYLPFSVIPFNIIRTVLASLIAYGLYRALKKADRKLFPKSIEKKADI